MIFDARLAIATGAVFLTAGFCAWQLSVSAEKASTNEKIKTLSQQVAVVRAQAETHLDKSANELTSIIQNQIAAAVDTPEFIKSSYLALTVLSSPGPNQPWQVEWSRTKNPQFDRSFLESQVTYWALDRLKGDNIQVLRMQMPDRRVYFVIALQIRFKSAAGEEVKVAAAVVPPAFFAGLTDSVKGTSDELMLVDAAGYSYAYPDQQYVGSSMEPHPLVKTLIKSPSSTDFKNTTTLVGNRAVGGYERLKNANLYVLISSPLPPRSQVAIEAFLQVGIVTLAIAMLSALLIALINQRQSRKLQQLDTRLQVLNQRQSSPAEVTTFNAEKERLEAMRELAFSVVQYLRAPIAAMLGFAQIGQTKSDVTGAKESFAQIEKAARQSREFLEGLAKINGFEKLDMRPMAIENLVQQSLTHVRAKIEKRGVTIEENYKTTEKAEVAANELRAALQTLLLYFGERLALATGLKRLYVDVEQAATFVKIRVADSGLTPAPEQLRRFFEPFAVNGMHMATLRALVESFKGTIRADKNDSQGLKIEIDLPQHLAVQTTTPTQALEVTKPQITTPEISKTEKSQSEVSKSAPPIPQKEEPDFKVLGQPLDEKVAPNVQLPPVPNDSDVTVKEELSAAEELSVVIRKPKIRVEN